MLKYRILTALILIPLVLAGIFYLPTMAFAITSALVFMLAAWEWAGLSSLTTQPQRWVYLFTLSITLILLYQASSLTLLIAANLSWLVMLCFVLFYSLFAKLWQHLPWLRAPLGLWLLGTGWYGLNCIQQLPSGPWYLLFLLLFVWGADTGAYFAGLRWGKHKLAPHISPGKSIEGVLGGTVASILVAVIGGWFFYGTLGKEYGSLILLALAISLVSVLGDLAESLVKRQAAVKDSGNLLPGHGGLLDRIDSLLSAAPLFALWLLLTLHP